MSNRLLSFSGTLKPSAIIDRQDTHESFCAGGDFWEKARTLFIRSAKVVNPEAV
ncbi:hypothetical protein [Pseudomonas sp. PS02303]|uniref:hypothetical protein n=1 Tax=Pseudomonas sp. PS02303 TaxID=2991429 RepID=UPI00249A8FBD|nr:hypothetical protein [Pseudomonas sp. PS02303]